MESEFRSKPTSILSKGIAKTNNKKDQRTEIGTVLLRVTTYLTVGENFSPCSVMLMLPAMVLGSAFNFKTKTPSAASWDNPVVSFLCCSLSYILTLSV